VYDVDGLRDSVGDGETGYITAQNTPNFISDHIVNLHKSSGEPFKVHTGLFNSSNNFTINHIVTNFIKSFPESTLV